MWRLFCDFSVWLFSPNVAKAALYESYKSIATKWKHKDRDEVREMSNVNKLQFNIELKSIKIKMLCN